MKRREFLKVSGLGLMASGATYASGAVVVPGVSVEKEAAGFRVGPFLQNLEGSEVSVNWMTTTGSYGYVEYGVTEELGMKADVESDGLREANNVIHRVGLKGLAAGKRYFYRACFQPIEKFEPYKLVYGAEQKSEVRSFVTRDPGAGRVRFVMYNDLHDNVEQWEKLHGFVKEEKFDFALLNGDVTDFMQDEKQLVDHFLGMATKLFGGELPFIYARGNHETRGAFSREMKGYLGMPGDRFYYAFTQGPARFVVLDSGEDKADSAAAYSGLVDFDGYRAVQEKWLEEELKSEAWKSARWRVAIWHIPGFGSDDWYTTTQVREKWHSRINEAKADIFLAGHTHKYMIIKGDAKLGHDYPVVIGGGPKWGKGTVTTVEIDEKNIRVVMIRDDGEKVGELVV